MSSNDLPLSQESQVQSLLEEVLDSDLSVDDVCAEFPELIDEVRLRLKQLRRVDAQIDELFPHSDSTPGLAVGAATSWSSELPRISGYEVQEVLGRGGMGVVYKAVHLKLNRTVALKMLLAGAYASKLELSRFVREAEAVASLRHPNIVQVYDVGEVDGRPYYTMEYVEGGSLARMLSGIPQPILDSARLVVVLAKAIHSAHQAGVVHRDLKPANILRTDDGTPKISDFGLARRAGVDAGLTSSGVRVGTPSYMAPEQLIATSAGIGPAVDIHALGLLLYEMIAGELPFRGASISETERRLITEEAKPFSRASARVPRDLETICLKCLQKDPARRYQSAAELAEDLERFLRYEPIHARPITHIERSSRWMRRNPLAVALGVTLLILSGVILVEGIQWVARAATRRAEKAQIAERWASAEALVEQGRFAEARNNLERLNDGGFDDLHQQIDQSLKELNLVEQLDAVSLSRVAIFEGRYDIKYNKVDADKRYQALFEQMSIGKLFDDPQIVGDRICSSEIKLALVAAFDDWATCTNDSKKRDWLLDVARHSDPDPTGWRDQVRSPGNWGDQQTLLHLANSPSAERASVQLLRVLGDRMGTANMNSIEFRKQVQQRHADDFLANFSLADALRETTPAESIRYYQAALAIRPRAAAAHNNIAVALAAIGRTDEAVQDFRQAIAIDPSFMLAHYNLGLLFAQMGKTDDAAQQFEESLRTDPSSAYAHYNLGLALRTQGRVKEAIEHFRKAIELEPTYVHTHYNLGLALHDIGQLKDAIAEYEITIGLDPKYAVAQRFLGLALVECGKPEEAIEHYQSALDADPKDVYTHNDLGRALVTLGRMDESLQQHKQAVEIDPKFARAWNDYGIALRLSGRLDEAEECFNTALQIGPRDTFALYQLGVTFVAAGKNDKAIESFRHAIQVDNKYIAAHIALGEALVTERQFAAAKVALSRCLEVLPLGDPQRDAVSNLVKQCDSEQAKETPLQ